MLLEKYVLNRIQTMKELALSRNEIERFYKRYDGFIRVRLKHADEYQTNGETEKAIELLKAGKDTFSDGFMAVTDYSSHLIDIYCKENMIDELTEELEFNIFHCYQKDLKYVCMLKEMVDEKHWIDLRSRILKADTCRSIHTDVLSEEEMLQELLKEALNDNGIELIERYEKQLRKKYPNEIRDKYATYVCDVADHISDRRHYRQLMKELKKLTRYAGGRELAEEIAIKWSARYSRRPAFIEELKKTGFLI